MAYQEEQKRGSEESVKFSSATSNPLLKTPPTADVDWVWLNNSTRQDPITGHYYDDHTRSTLTPQQYRSIFQEAQELNVPEPTAEQLAAFERDGVILLHDVIPLHIVEALNNRVDAVFNGKHDTNSYPDEWYWRSEISPPDITRHAVGAWKADRGLASLVFNASLARFAAKLSGLNGVRIGGDTHWVKPPGGERTSVSYHRDSHYTPPRAQPQVTMWVALSDIGTENSPLEHVLGSHLWPNHSELARDEFMRVKKGQSSYRDGAYAEAAKHGIQPEDVKFRVASCRAGSIVMHNAHTWHASAPNTSKDQWRRSMGIHYVPDTAKHTQGDGYIYQRYRLIGTEEFQESFFPILWQQQANGQIYRSPWVKQYLDLEGEKDEFGFPPYPAR